jgi:flagellar basal body-associated protein FliL
MTRHEAQLEVLELHAPALRNEFLFLIPDFDGAALKKPKGKEKLRKKALKASKKVMRKLTGKEVVDGIYFTTFYIQ